MVAIAKGKYADWITEDGLLRVEGWARDGLTDEQISKNMGISHQTLYEWSRRFPAISESLKRGKAPVDQEVENALLKRALGYEYEEVTTETEEIPLGKMDEDGNPIILIKTKTKRTNKAVIPDTTAQIFWLKNRRPDKWRDKPITAEDTSTMEKLDAMLAEVRSHAFNS